MKINKHIEIVRSSNAAFSSMGQKSCNMIKNILEQKYERVNISLVGDMSDLERTASKRPDLMFLGVKRLPVNASDKSGKNVWAATYLDDQELTYTGSGAAAIALDFSKPRAKQAVKAAGINTATYFVAQQGTYRCEQDLPSVFPLFVKPPNGGGGKGIGPDSIVHDFNSLENRIEYIANKFNTGTLVEEYLPGREFSVALLEDNDSDKLIAMPVELIAEQNDRGDRILGQSIKANDVEQVIAVQEGSLKQEVVELAKRVFKTLGARDYGRIDIRLNAQGVPYFLEANLVPGLAMHDFTSYFTAACWINQAMDYKTMILHITELGLSRSAGVNASLHDLVMADNIASSFLSPVFDAA